MKLTKTILALLLAAILGLGLGMPAMAEELEAEAVVVEALVIDAPEAALAPELEAALEDLEDDAFAEIEEQALSFAGYAFYNWFRYTFLGRLFGMTTFSTSFYDLMNRLLGGTSVSSYVYYLLVLPVMALNVLWFPIYMIIDGGDVVINYFRMLINSISNLFD